jgi:hypothetical protein
MPAMVSSGRVHRRMFPVSSDTATTNQFEATYPMTLSAA